MLIGLYKSTIGLNIVTRPFAISWKSVYHKSLQGFEIPIQRDLRGKYMPVPGLQSRLQDLSFSND
jgi:hypothetical protein